jgi:hypothetical protein
MKLIGKNWVLLILLYNILAVVFPDAQWLKRLGDAFADRFPVFKK